MAKTRAQTRRQRYRAMYQRDDHRYNHSPSGRERTRRYNAGPAAKAAMRRYRHTPEFREHQRFKVQSDRLARRIRENAL